MICCCAHAPAPSVTPPPPEPTLPSPLTPSATLMSLSLSPSPSPSTVMHTTHLISRNAASGMLAVAAMAELDVVQCTALRKPLVATKTTSLPLPLLSHKRTTRSVSGGAATPSSSAAASAVGQTQCWRNTLRRMFQRK